MKNKLLVELVVPEVDEKYNVYIPINKKVGNVVGLLMRAVKDMTNGIYNGTSKTALYDKYTGEKYAINVLIRETNIRNGTTLVLI